MEIKIKWKLYELYKIPCLNNEKFHYFSYNFEPSILICIWVYNDDILNEELRSYFYWRKLSFIQNKYLINNYRTRNQETWLLEMDFSNIPDFPEFIIDIVLENLFVWKYLIIDIETNTWIEDPNNPWNYIWQYWILKIRKLNYFLSELEKIKKIKDKQYAMALSHNLIEMVISDLCKNNWKQPTNNFDHNLNHSIISNDEEKDLIKSMKKKSGVVAHWNTSTEKTKQEAEKYYETTINFIIDLVNKYYK